MAKFYVTTPIYFLMQADVLRGETPGDIEKGNLKLVTTQIIRRRNLRGLMEAKLSLLERYKLNPGIELEPDIEQK